MSTSEGTYAVFSPEGKVAARSAGAVQRVDDLSNAVIAEVWDYVFRGDEMFAIMEEELTKRFPGVTFVNYSTFGTIHGYGEAEAVARLPELLRDNRCNAVLAGVGA